MKRMKSLPRMLLIGVCFLLFAASLAVGSYAYFKTDLAFNGYANVKIDLMFDRLTSDASGALEKYWDTFVQDDGLRALSGNDGTNGGEQTGDYAWGHKGNPYVISHPKHLQNLSTLQNIGYFKNKFLETNYTVDPTTGNKVLKERNTGTYFDGYNIPHFLVATAEGKPIVIDASEETIKPIGSDEFPFVGVLRGVSDTTTAVSLSTNKTTTTSAIDGITVSDTPAKVDHGFFGQIGYLGSELENKPVDANGDVLIFEGQISVVSDLLLSDAKIVVQSSLWEKVIAFLTDHLFTYSGLSEEEQANVPHENHHIGILAGHVEYANFSNISVYYSSDKIAAFDLNDATEIGGVKANYSSVTGIFGFLYNLNPTIIDGKITVGSGKDNTDISYGYTGGGGLLSGDNPGYVYAKEMYETYKYKMVDGVLVDNTDSTFPIYTAYKKDEKDEVVALCKEWVRSSWLGRPIPTGRYYFTDGVFTFALSDIPGTDKFTDIWPAVDGGSAGLSTIPTFMLGGMAEEDWEIGKLGNQYEFYADLKPVTSTADFTGANGNPKENLLIGLKDTAGELYLMDLGKVGTSITAYKVENVPVEGGVRYIYGNPQLLYNDLTGYCASISPANSQCTIKSRTGNKLGVGVYKTFFTNDKLIYCGTADSFSVGFIGDLITRTYKNNYNFTLTPSSSGTWQLYNENSQQYITASTGGFNISATASDAAQLYIYEVTTRAVPVTSDNAPDGYMAKKPVVSQTITTTAEDGTQTSESRSLTADQYVLHPTDTVAVDPNDYKTARKSTAPSYDLVSLESLGWKDSRGNPITQVNKMFSLTKAVDWGVALDIFSLSFTSGMIKAPIGSDKKEYNIPTGCIAFKINKIPTDGAKVRVIVALPTGNSPTSLGLDTGALGATEIDGHYENEDYYFGIWKGNEQTSGIQYTGFNIENALTKVELPRSQPKIKADGTGYIDEFIVVNFDAGDGKGMQQYRAYLQGDTYLLAYEFTVAETGVYIMGASNSAMEIVYFSADGVASAGRDGTGGTQIGTVDFVYDYNNKIVLVSDTDPSTDVKDEDYQYYYQSYIVIYFDNLIKENQDFVAIHDERLYVYRWVNAAAAEAVKSTMTVNVNSSSETDNAYVKAVGYAKTQDTLIYSYKKRQ